jgi:hypothetical protein
MRRRAIALLTGVLLGTLLLSGCAQAPRGAGQGYPSPSVSAQTSPPSSSPEPTGEPVPSASPEPSAVPGQPAPEQPASEPPSCAPLDGAVAVAEAIPMLPPPFTQPGLADIPWDAENAGIDTYDPCAALSWIVVPIQGATGSSPHQVALYHRGEFIGVATEISYGFWPDVERLSDEEIEITYRWPQAGEGNAEASGRSPVRFAWDEATGSVVMTGELPPGY